MSVGAISWAFNLELPSAGQKLTLLAICNYADERGEAWPSQERLAKDTSQTDRAVRGHLAALEKAGIIRRKKRYDGKGKRTSDLITINRKNLPEEKTTTGKNTSSLPEASSGNPSLEPSLSKKTSSSSLTRAGSAEFDQWWGWYPHQVGKGAARKAFETAIKKTDLQTLIAGVQQYQATKPSDQKWCNPTTWLNQERWTDQPAVVQPVQVDAQRFRHRGQPQSIAQAVQRFVLAGESR